MASVTLAELVRAVREHPDYRSWRDDVSASVALHVSFGECRGIGDSDAFDAVDGTQIAIDWDENGLICGIEFL